MLERLIAVVAPHYCLNCGKEGSLVCAWCLPDFATPLPSRCALCRKQTPDSQVCEQCRRKTALRHIWVRTSYDGLPKELIHGFKFERQQAAAEIVASLMTESLPFLPKETVVVHIPTTSGHVRQRGYDHAELIARALSRNLDRPYKKVLRRIGQDRQVGSKRADRLVQLEHAFTVDDARHIKGLPVLLVDDVITTGGTLMAAAKTLRQAGAKTVDAVVFAQKE